MKLHHKTPCNECPWRLASTAGWLGGHPAEYYADSVMNNEVPACHCRDHGADSDDTAFCAGALSVMANACMSAWNAAGDGDAARTLVGRRDDTFRHPMMFYEHHAGKPYTHPLLRSAAS